MVLAALRVGVVNDAGKGGRVVGHGFSLLDMIRGMTGSEAASVMVVRWRWTIMVC